jgi:hypothetical protein
VVVAIDSKLRTITSFLKSKGNLSLFFCFSVLALDSLFLIGNFFTHGVFFNELFYLITEDSGFDFYVFLSESTTGRQTYLEGNPSFNPPLLRLLMKLIYRSFPVELQQMYAGSSIYNAPVDIRTNAFAQMSFILIVVFVLTSMCLLLFSLKKGSVFERAFFSLISTFCIGIVFAIERGNVVIVAALFLLIFCIAHESPNKILRELSYVSLAVACGLKIYPIVFIALLVRSRNCGYAGIVRTICYSVFFLFGPMLYYGGYDGIVSFLESVFSQTSFEQTTGVQSEAGVRAGTLNMSSIMVTWLRFFGLSIECASDIVRKSSIFIYIICVIGIILACFFMEKWQKISMLVLVMILGAGISHTYVLTYMPIAVLYFLDCRHSRNRFAIFYFLLFIGLIAIIPIPNLWYIESLRVTGERFTTMNLFHQILILTMFLLLFYEGSRQAVIYIKDKLGNMGVIKSTFFHILSNSEPTKPPA